MAARKKKSLVPVETVVPAPTSTPVLEPSVAFHTLLLQAGRAGDDYFGGEEHLAIVRTMIERATIPREFSMIALHLRTIRRYTWGAAIIELWCDRLEKVVTETMAFQSHDFENLCDRIGRQVSPIEKIAVRERQMVKNIEDILRQRRQAQPSEIPPSIRATSNGGNSYAKIAAFR